MTGMLEALRLLKVAGCARAYVDGSFVTAKEKPGDFDARWDAEGVDFDLIDKRLLTFDRAAQRRRPRSSVNCSSPTRAPIPRARFSATSSRPTARADARASWSSIRRTCRDHQPAPVPRCTKPGRALPASAGGTRCTSYWHMPRTLVTQQATSNAWLAAQGLVRISTNLLVEGVKGVALQPAPPSHAHRSQLID